ncbi:AMP-binding protein [Actinomadura rugatobispora]|uniref:AMP-binding protein n=1 Tax=Actinomadura rugatobispora TaxID=1994 RepID=A0ABW0ZX14_9ACTN|nr:FadD3 family acyl-CoA ligase [Actinomadura rugatobispora]
MAAEALPSREDRWEYIPPEFRIRDDERFLSIPDAVRVAAARHPGREAIIEGDLRLTFARLEEVMIDAVRAAMALGVRPGDRVAVWAPNSARWILAALAVQGAGGILVPLNTRFKGEEAAYILRKSGATALFTVTGFLGSDYPGMARRAAPDLAALAPGRVVVLSGEAATGDLSWEEFMAAGAPVGEDRARAAVDAVAGETVSDIMFTSGTTGRPKGVVLTHGQSLRAHGWLARVMDFRAGDRYLIIPPFFHTFGYKAGWMACIVHGATILPQTVFSAGTVLETMERERVSILCGPPTLFQDLLASPRLPEADLSALRVVMASAAQVPPELNRRIREVLRPEILHSGYGLTEATSLVTATRPRQDDFADITTTVGRAAWEVEVRIVDPEGRDVPRGTAGELWCRGYTVMSGYWDEPAATAEAITEDGWLRTGDVAVMDDRGFIRIVDRIKDVVIVGGFNVYPAEVERILGEHPDVESIAVVGVPDERMGEVTAAFVVPRPSAALDAEEFRTWAAGLIAGFKAPRHVAVVEALPRNAGMKVLKNELRERARDLVQRGSGTGQGSP